jgi:hypothetical protein
VRISLFPLGTPGDYYRFRVATCPWSNRGSLVLCVPRPFRLFLVDDRAGTESEETYKVDDGYRAYPLSRLAFQSGGTYEVRMGERGPTALVATLRGRHQRTEGLWLLHVRGTGLDARWQMPDDEWTTGPSDESLARFDREEPL